MSNWTYSVLHVRDSRMKVVKYNLGYAIHKLAIGKPDTKKYSSYASVFLFPVSGFGSLILFVLQKWIWYLWMFHLRVSGMQKLPSIHSV